MLLANSQPIAVSSLLVMALPVTAVLIILWRWRLKPGDSAWALARMLVQLAAVGYVLKGVFLSDTPWVVLGVVVVMVTAAGWISIRTLCNRTPKVFAAAAISILVGGGISLLLVTQGVLGLDPWFQPRYFVPLAGMIFTGSMNTVSLAAERYAAESAHGASYVAARNAAMQAAMLPTVNALLAVGLVSLPGMLTGQVLAGVDPLEAARYQVMVMMMWFSASGFSASSYLWLRGRVDSAAD